ncbi:MAG: hypothetical protein H6659_00810 [Ardenticatenaceae bacterium]|nr:hypothetical protein [Ardenticatenaceae bacterium]
MNPSRMLLILFVFCAVVMTACGGQEPEPTAVPTPIVDAAATETAVPPTATPLTEPVFGLATVESVQVLTLESFPVQINVLVRGVLPNECTSIDDIVSERDGNAFTVVITTVQDPDVICTQSIVPFEETVALDVVDLPAGTYTVNVNGISGSFTLDVDNTAPEAEATVSASGTAVSGENGTINGRVWHDVCAAGAEGADTAPAEGCVTLTDGATAANGQLEVGEPGIEGVRVSLGEGECPADGIGTAVTDIAGNYTFAELSPGTYCVSVDPLDEQNQEILVPGQWTFPEVDLGETTVDLTAGSVISDVNFGWDFQFLPLPETNAADCTTSIEFVQDLNIPDDTAFPPGAEFVKRWELRNNGTCIWTTDYSVVFVGGDLMGAQEVITLTKAVVPDQTVEIAVPMVAPETPGTYRGNWQIADANGDPFGIDGFVEDAFWLQIVVAQDAPPLATPEPNSAAVGGIVWDDFCVNSNPGRGCWEYPDGSGIFIGDGSQTGSEPSLPGVTISLSGGVCPSDGTVPAAGQVIETMETGEDGRFLFDGLAGGTYCIFMDALSTANVDLLIPGNWTWPAVGVGSYTVALDEGEERLDLDFGWDYQD